jgi:lipooligosaccharide transport system ATP-binding protein
VRLSVWQRVRELREQGTTLLLTTHYMDEAERLCDRLVVMAEGRVVADGAPAQLIRELLAPEALELDVAPEDEAVWLPGTAGLARLRSGRRLVLYVEDAGALLQRVRRRNPGDGSRHPAAVVRPTNLEDVFLKLTGTRLEAGGVPG